jgi:hypothetical protein
MLLVHPDIICYESSPSKHHVVSPRNPTVSERLGYFYLLYSTFVVPLTGVESFIKLLGPFFVYSSIGQKSARNISNFL